MRQATECRRLISHAHAIFSRPRCRAVDFIGAPSRQRQLMPFIAEPLRGVAVTPTLFITASTARHATPRAREKSISSRSAADAMKRRGRRPRERLAHSGTKVNTGMPL